MGMTGAFVQEYSDNIPIITVSTIKPDYSEGELIEITGNTHPLVDFPQRVTVLVVHPHGYYVRIAQIIPDDDGNFSHSTIADGQININGTYAVRAQYGNEKANTTFNFIEDGVIPEPNQ